MSFAARDHALHTKNTAPLSAMRVDGPRRRIRTRFLPAVERGRAARRRAVRHSKGRRKNVRTNGRNGRTDERIPNNAGMEERRQSFITRRANRKRDARPLAALMTRRPLRTGITGANSPIRGHLQSSLMRDRGRCRRAHVPHLADNNAISSARQRLTAIRVDYGRFAPFVRRSLVLLVPSPAPPAEGRRDLTSRPTCNFSLRVNAGPLAWPASPRAITPDASARMTLASSFLTSGTANFFTPAKREDSRQRQRWADPVLISVTSGALFSP